jgi:hypothetical protein
MEAAQPAAREPGLVPRYKISKVTADLTHNTTELGLKVSPSEHADIPKGLPVTTRHGDMERTPLQSALRAAEQFLPAW